MCDNHEISEDFGVQSGPGGVLSQAARLAGLPAFQVGVPGLSTDKPRAVVIIEGGTLIDPDTGDTVADAVVVIVDGLVVATGSRDETRDAVQEFEADATRVNADGRFIVPGFIDSHVHASDFDGAAMVMQHGGTTLRSGSTAFFQDIALARVPAYAPGLVPRVLAAGVFVSPADDSTYLADPDLAVLAGRRDDVKNPADLAYITRVNLKRGAKVIKTRSNPRAGLAEQDPLDADLNQEQIAAIVHAANGAPVLCHGYSTEGIAGAVAAGVKSIEHGVYVDEATLAKMAKQGTAFTPTFCTIRNLTRRDDAVLQARGEQYQPILAEAIRMANEMGVTVVGGTDTAGTQKFMPIGEEAMELANAGLSNLQALQSITTAGAKLHGIDRFGVGRLVRGGVGDAVVLGSNPLENAAALMDVKAVVGQGVVVRNDS